MVLTCLCPTSTLSLGCQITKLKQQLQRTKLSRSGKEKERGSPLQGDHAVRGALRVCFHPLPRAPRPLLLPGGGPLGPYSNRQTVTLHVLWLRGCSDGFSENLNSE